MGRNQEIAQGHSDKEKFDYHVLLAFCIMVFGIPVFLGLIYFGIYFGNLGWQRYARNRTATIRAVVWNTSEQTIYMNDGTVWGVRLNRSIYPEDIPAPEPIIGDTARYENVGHFDDAPSELCSIHDVTIGADYLGERISSPFTHSSCPER